MPKNLSPCFPEIANCEAMRDYFDWHVQNGRGKALKFWQDMARVDKSVYLDQTGQKFEQMFASGSIGMILDGPWLLYTVKEAKLNYGAVQLPGTDGDHQTISGPDLWVLFDRHNAQRAAASYDFMHWLTSPEQDVRWNVAYGNLPLRKSAASTPEFAKFLADFPGGDVFFANLDNAKKARPTVPGYQTLSLNVAKAIKQIFLDRRLHDDLREAARAAGVTEDEVQRLIPTIGTSTALVLHADRHTRHIHVRFICDPGAIDCRD